MWTIRQEQVDAFRQAALQQFEDQMVKHLERFSPQHCKVAGEPAVRQVIRLGIEQARQYGFTNRGPVRFYIELMFMFGSYFDTDPQYPWGQAVLTHPENADQAQRADSLYAAMNRYLEEVSGHDHCYLIDAMRRFQQLRIDDFFASRESLEASIRAKLDYVYPQRCQYLGEQILISMIRFGFQLAEKYGLGNDRGKVLMTSFTFAMGHGFANDPLYGWVSRRLTDSRWPTPAARIEELYSKGILYLSRNQTLAKKDDRT